MRIDDRDGYSIVFTPGDAGPCARCGAETGRGPVGWNATADRPICDACLIEVSPHVGMVLNVALIFRQVGAIEPGEDQLELIYQVLMLARVYESAASKVWPARGPFTTFGGVRFCLDFRLSK